jgi:hypothetical protein
MADDYTSRCPLCGDFILIRIDSIDCVSAKCGYTRPRSRVEDFTECRKPGEPRFVPPTRFPHPNGGK